MCITHDRMETKCTRTSCLVWGGSTHLVLDSYITDITHTKPKMTRTLVFVGGEIGRSPRMQYHALSAANIAGHDVQIVGYRGPAPHSRVSEHPHIELVHLPNILPVRMGLLVALVRALLQAFAALWTLLFRTKRPDYILIQVSRLCIL